MDEVLRRIVEFTFRERLKYAVVCEEHHLDGTPHLHAVLVFEEKLNITACDFFDVFAGKHGNYQACRSPKKALQYVIKDGHFVAHGINVGELLQSRGSDYSQAVNMIIQGSTLIEVFQQFPGTYGRHFAALQRVHTVHHALQAQPHQWSLPEDRITFLEQSPIGTWLASALGNMNRPNRSSQLFIQGPPGVGKSFLASVLRRCFRVYTFPDQAFLEDWTNNIELVIYDEPEAHRLRFMNKFLSGEVVRLPARYNPVVKNHNPPFIFLSNNSPDEIYKEASLPHNSSYPNYLAFVDRLQIVKISESFLDFVKVLDQWYPPSQ